MVPIRGNVGTRLAKVTGGELDATVLARAGLVRLGLEEHASDLLDTQRFLPAVGQGIVGLTCRADDLGTRERLEREARDPRAWASALAERAFLRAMKGGCNAPVGGHATVDGERLSLAGRVLSVDGTRIVQGSVVGACGEAEALGLQLAEELAARGGRDLVEEARALADG